MHDSAQALLADIEQFCRRRGIAESTFGRLAVNDGKLCARLRSGKSITLSTAGRVRSYIVSQAGATDNRDSGPPARSPRTSFRPFRPFRISEKRQEYLAFVDSCNEQSVVAERAVRELARLRPRPPALRVFDAGPGEGTLLGLLMRAMHHRFPDMPFFIAGRETDAAALRLCLGKLPDRFVEHPASVVTLTNLRYRHATHLAGNEAEKRAAWQEVVLEGDSAHEFGLQLQALERTVGETWQQPSVLVVFRSDQRSALEPVIPRPGSMAGPYDLILASQAWRASRSARFKAEVVLAPLTRALAPGGRLLAVQSSGDDPGLELVREIWPDENPFRSNRYEIIRALKRTLGGESGNLQFAARADARAIFEFHMRSLPKNLGENIGPPALLAAWNAAVYVAEIDGERIAAAMSSERYLQAAARILRRYDGLWFNDESFVIARPAHS